MTTTGKEQVTTPAEVPRSPDVASIRGAAGTLDRELSWEEMRDIAREARLRAKAAPKDHECSLGQYG